MSPRADDPTPDLHVPRRRAAMPLIRESIVPWLGAAVVQALLILVFILTGQELATFEVALLAIGFCTTLTAAGLVSARSTRELGERDREERARPGAEELSTQPAPASYVDGMACWTSAMLELIDHAVEASDDDHPSRADLAAAAADTRDLRDLLDASHADHLTINDTAMIHAVCSLWESNQPRIEQLAANVDPAWHRRWRARSVADRNLRHGAIASRPVPLPYRL